MTNKDKLQQACVDKILYQISQRILKIVLAACPGAGKTWMSFDVIYRLKKINPNLRVLVLTHGTHVLKTNYLRQCEEYFAKKHDGEIMFSMSDNIDDDAIVHVVLPQKIQRRRHLINYDLVIVDEAHDFYFAKDGMVKRILKKVKPKNQLLLTGTPSVFVRENKLKENSYSIIDLPMIDLLDELSDVHIELASTSLKIGNDDYNRKDEMNSKKVSDDFDRTFSSSIANELLEGIYKKLNSRFKTKPNLYRLIPYSWRGVLNYLQKTIIVTNSISNANAVKDYFESKIGNRVTISHSKLEDDFESQAIEDFKTDNNLILIVVKRANLGYNFPNLMNLVDLSFTRNINRIYQMFCRVNRQATIDGEKFFFKIVPNELAGYFEHIMTCALHLMLSEYLLKFDGNNFNNELKILARKNWKKNNQEKAVVKCKKVKKIKYEYMGMESLQSFKFNYILHKDNEVLSPYCYITLNEVKKELLNIETRISPIKWTLESAVREAVKYKTINEIRENNRACYNWLQKYFPRQLYEIFPQHKLRTDWTLETASNEAKQFNFISEFRVHSHGCYKWLRRHYRDEFYKIFHCHKPRVQPNTRIITKRTLESALKEATKFNVINEFKKNNHACFQWFRRHYPNELTKIFQI